MDIVAKQVKSGGMRAIENNVNLRILSFSVRLRHGPKEGEIEAFRNMLTRFPDGIMACVSDSYNIWNACEKVGRWHLFVFFIFIL